MDEGDDLMMTFRSGTWILSLVVATALTGCKSEAERAHDAAVRARILEEQQKLDAIEQRRSEVASAESCRRVTDVSLEANSVAVDKSHCTPDQLKLEEGAEKQERQERLAKSVSEIMAREQKVFDKMRSDPSFFKSSAKQ